MKYRWRILWFLVSLIATAAGAFADYGKYVVARAVRPTRYIWTDHRYYNSYAPRYFLILSDSPATLEEIQTDPKFGDENLHLRLVPVTYEMWCEYEPGDFFYADVEDVNP